MKIKFCDVNGNDNGQENGGSDEALYPMGLGIPRNLRKQ